MTNVYTPTVPTTTPSSSSSSSSSTAANIAAGQQSLASSQQTFLQLLTTQLQNQDPTAPMDSNQFTEQLVEMTGVQQQILTNQLLQQLVQNQGAISDPVGLIGKTVTSTSATATLNGGQASWYYSLPATAASVQVTVTDSLGNTVAQQSLGPQAPGEQSFTWNGKDLTGSQLADGGAYTLQVTASDASGHALTTPIYQRGVATAIQQNNGTQLVTINGSPVPLSTVSVVSGGS